jgi:hypothetical protein
VAALDERHRARQHQLAGRLELGLARLVGRLETLSEEELRAYHDGAYPLVAGGQRSAAVLAAGYGLARTRRPGRPTAPMDVDGALKSTGVLVTTESRSLVAPVLRARHLVADGTELVAAKQQAASYAGQLGTLDLQAAQRVGLEQGAGAGGERVIGYRKEPSGEACDWCQQTAGEVYGSPDAVPFHANDACAVAPVIEGEEA